MFSHAYSACKPAIEIRDANTDRPIIRLNEVNNLGLAILVQDKMHITQLFQEGKTIITCKSRRCFDRSILRCSLGCLRAFLSVALL